MDQQQLMQVLSNPNMRQMWGAAQPRAGFQRLDDGDYICQLEAMTIGQAQSGRLQLDSHFIVAEGPDAGADIHKYDGMETPQNLEFLKGYLSVMGVQYRDDDPRSLLVGINNFVRQSKQQNEYYKIRLRTKGDFQNVMFQGILDHQTLQDMMATQPTDQGYVGEPLPPMDNGQDQFQGQGFPEQDLGQMPGGGEYEFSQMTTMDQAQLPDGPDPNFQQAVQTSRPPRNQRQAQQPAQQPRQQQPRGQARPVQQQAAPQQQQPRQQGRPLQTRQTQRR